jgi:rRNA maturation RNase YbeY
MAVKSRKPHTGSCSDNRPVQIQQPYRSLPVPVEKLHRLADVLYKKERILFSQKLSVVFCSDHCIRQLNARYRSINRSTDVLSFTIGDPDLLGEIYISLQRAKVQSQCYATTLGNELLRLFVHGFYHCLGYDHKTGAGRLNMERKELRALKLK